MLLVTTETISGKEFETLGLVSGSMVQSKNAFKDIGAGLKSLIGGELGSYTKMMQEARDVATQRMVDQAKQMGADAVVNVRFASSAVMEGAAEIMATGTAVNFK